jgi:hypothetical protein
MATRPKSATRTAELPDDAGLPHFCFGLRQLLGFVAALCGLLATMVIAGGLTALAVFIASAIVAAHVFGTALGGRLRAHADRQQAAENAAGRHDWKFQNSRDGRHEARLAAQSAKAVNRSSWYGSDRAAFSNLRRQVFAGIAVGGAGGAVLLSLMIGRHTSAAGLAVGAVSLAVLGGWLAFLASSFVAIFRCGWQEAVAEQQRDETKSTAALSVVRRQG